MRPITRRILHGALSGAIGAGCMTVLRMLAHRARLIDQMVPQAVETWAKHHAAVRMPATPSKRALHHIADQLIHLGYGATLGGLYGAVHDERARVGGVLAFGVGTWFLGSFLLLPGLKIARPEWRAGAPELVVNVSAHLLFAATVALLSEELEKQSTWQPLPYPLSLAARTG